MTSLSPPAFPHVEVILAMSADGKIADRDRHAARFGSDLDRAHLETRIAQVDAVLFGAGTLRAYGSSLPITNPHLLAQRHQSGRAPQPRHIVVSAQGNLDPNCRFFQQAIPRWLLTTPQGAVAWQTGDRFEKVLTLTTVEGTIDWLGALQQFKQWGIDRLAVLGGGQLVAQLLALNVVHELWLTVCPLLLGGSEAPSPVDGLGFGAKTAPQLQLISAEVQGQEVFLAYRVRGQAAPIP